MLEVCYLRNPGWHAWHWVLLAELLSEVHWHSLHQGRSLYHVRCNFELIFHSRIVHTIVTAQDPNVSIPHSTQSYLQLPMGKWVIAYVNNCPTERLPLGLVEGHCVRKAQQKLLT